jgi:hypothetical protein
MRASLTPHKIARLACCDQCVVRVRHARASVGVLRASVGTARIKDKSHSVSLWTKGQPSRKRCYQTRGA